MIYKSQILKKKRHLITRKVWETPLKLSAYPATLERADYTPLPTLQAEGGSGGAKREDWDMSYTHGSSAQQQCGNYKNEIFS